MDAIKNNIALCYENNFKINSKVPFKISVCSLILPIPIWDADLFFFNSGGSLRRIWVVREYGMSGH